MKDMALVVFDMDGVLIDVSTSYRETVRQTAYCFFSQAKNGRGLPNPLFSLSELAVVKQSGGLNNDWDLTHQVIQLLCRRIDCESLGTGSGEAWSDYQRTLSRWDASPLIQFLTRSDQPLSQLLGDEPIPFNDFITRMYQGDVGSGNVIKQMFQEIYLGQTLFQETYKIPSVLHQSNGLNHSEKLIIDRYMIEQISQVHALGIATGRPRAEALYPLRLFKLEPFFDRVLTLDDCLSAEKKFEAKNGTQQTFSKPNPYMLDAIVQGIDPLPEKRFYVGDMPDDMVAASRSRDHFIGIGFTATAPNPANLESKLRDAGAEQVFSNAADLVSFLMAL